MQSGDYKIYIIYISSIHPEVNILCYYPEVNNILCYYPEVNILCYYI